LAGIIFSNFYFFNSKFAWLNIKMKKKGQLAKFRHWIRLD
jgi:hypothetical protein